MILETIDYPNNYKSAEKIREFCEKKSGRKMITFFIDRNRGVVHVKKFGEYLPKVVEEKAPENGENSGTLEA